MKTLSSIDLRDLDLKKAYTISVRPGSYKIYGVITSVKPDLDHPHWGSVYENGKLLASASYGQWFEFETREPV